MVRVQALESSVGMKSMQDRASDEVAAPNAHDVTLRVSVSGRHAMQAKFDVIRVVARPFRYTVCTVKVVNA